MRSASASIAILLAVSCGLGAVERAADPWITADVVLHLNEGRWIEREAVRFAAARGDDPKEVRTSVAHLLWQSTGLDGIDATRPGIVAWRNGRPGFTAALPVADRTLLIQQFGVVPPGQAPIVRTGDRDGTVIYTQNQRDSGLRELRLLVSAGTAFIGATSDECRILAAFGDPEPAGGTAPLSLTIRGTALRKPNPWLAGLINLLPKPAIPGDRPLVLGGHLLGKPVAWWDPLAAQITEWRIEARTDADSRLRVTITAELKADSALTAWLGQQRPALSRLSAAMRSANTAALVVAQPAFQGQWERALLPDLDEFRTAIGAGWTPAIDTGFRASAGLEDRTAGMAAAWEVDGEGALTELWASEHPRALEQGAYAAQVAAALAGGLPADTAIGGRAAWRLPGNAGWIAAGDRHVVAARGARAEARLGELLTKLASTSPPEGEPNLVTATIDLAALWRDLLVDDGTPVLPVVITVAIKPSGPTRLTAVATIPHQQIGKLLSRLRK